MNDSGNVTYTKHLKKVVESRHFAEDSLKRAIASINYVTLTVLDAKRAHEHIERCKELIISGNIILKTITNSEHIGAEHEEPLEEAYECFKEAQEEINFVLSMVEGLKK